MGINGIVSAIIVGAIIGGLGRLVIRGHQHISWLMTIVIGIIAALVGTFIATQLASVHGGSSSSSRWVWPPSV